MTKAKRYMLIYNPNAGRKRQLFSLHGSKTLRQIVELLQKHDIVAEVCITKKATDAKEFTQRAVKENYDVILSAGGDGTVEEIVNYMVGSKLTLGILPMGSYMNVARMLAIPHELDGAVAMLTKGTVRKIDLGVITKLSGKKLAQPYYFVETAGIGYEAKITEHAVQIEHGKFYQITNLLKIIHTYPANKSTVTLDNSEVIETDAQVITVSNGPYTGPAVKIAPKAKLNDHKLFVALFRMSKPQLIAYLLQMMAGKSNQAKEVKWHQAKEVHIVSEEKRKVHADSRIFGTTPASFSVAPNALSVITGFSDNK